MVFHLNSFVNNCKSSNTSFPQTPTTKDEICPNPNRQVHLNPNPNRKFHIFSIFALTRSLGLAFWVRVRVVFHLNSFVNNCKSSNTSFPQTPTTKDEICPNPNRQVHLNPNPNRKFHIFSIFALTRSLG